MANRAWLLIFLLVCACARIDVVPAPLRDRVEHDINFVELRENPSLFKGRLIVLGGIVLSGKWLREGTRIEILQLPLDRSLEPTTTLSDSLGRFLAVQKQFLDPATVPPGTRVTIVGEVVDAVTLLLDEMEYRYPFLEIKKLTIWGKRIPAYWIGPYPYLGAYWGSYWGPYWAPFWVR